MGDKKTAGAKATRFTKAQLLAAARYADRRDLLSALLEEDKTYTHTEVEQRVKTFMEKRMK